MREVGAWFLTSLLFGLMHFVNVVLGAPVDGTVGQLLAASTAGTTFYILRGTTGSLVWAMLLHGLWDFSAFPNRSGRGGGARHGPRRGVPPAGPGLRRLRHPGPTNAPPERQPREPRKGTRPDHDRSGTPTTAARFGNVRSGRPARRRSCRSRTRGVPKSAMSVPFPTRTTRLTRQNRVSYWPPGARVRAIPEPARTVSCRSGPVVRPVRRRGELEGPHRRPARVPVVSGSACATGELDRVREHDPMQSASRA